MKKGNLGAAVVATITLLSFHSKADVKPIMDQMLEQIFTLKPFIVSEVEYSSPKNTTVIDEALKKMIDLSQKINHEEKIKQTARQISGDSLGHQLQETELVFRLGNKSYSYWLLRSTLGNCISCHTQIPANSTKFESLSKGHFLTNNFEEAEFLYIIRNYDKALELYNKSIAGYPGNGIPLISIERAIARKVFYYTRVKRDLKALSRSLDADLKNKKFSETTRNLIQGYRVAAADLASEKSFDVSNKTEAQMKDYAQNVLKEELAGSIDYDNTKRNLRNLRLSGFLYEFLDKHPDTALKPEIYYWLSFCESRWDRGAYDSLPESYLRKCVSEFPQSAVAPKCFAEYKELVTSGYTGSSGTHLPQDVSDELKSLEKLIAKPAEKK